MILNALILNDYDYGSYATWVYQGKKKIETRMNRLFSYRGDIVICCGAANSVSEYAGKAMCIVNIYDGRVMQKRDEDHAMIEWHKDRKALLLKDWRYFKAMFDFAPLKVAGTFQGIFQMDIPDQLMAGLQYQHNILPAYPIEAPTTLF